MEISNSIMKYEYTGEDAKLLELKNGILQKEVDRLKADNARLRKENSKYRRERRIVYADMLDHEARNDEEKFGYIMAFLGGMVTCFAIVTVIVICAL